MWWLAGFLNIIIGSSLAGAAVIAALVIGYDTIEGILIAAVAGYLIGVPASWLIAKQILVATRQKN